MILIKTAEEIRKIRAAGKILAEVAEVIKSKAKEGVALSFLDKLATDLIRKAGAEPAFLDYKPIGAKRPYKYSICASINEVVVHGEPTSYKLKSGDLLKLDFGAIFDGYYADTALTLPIGDISPKAKRLIAVTHEALIRAIAETKPNNTLGDIGYAIQNFVEKQGFKVVKGLTGHGIGRDLHEDPNVLNEGRPHTGLKLKAGMVLAIEPMVSAGSDKIIQLKNDSYKISDDSLSAHFEHTIAVTEKGSEILTVL